LAVRDEIVELVKRGLGSEGRLPARSAPAPEPATRPEPGLPPQAEAKPETPPPPRTGVEIAEIETRQGTRYYTMRDLRNGNLVKNVTRGSARRLWRYAIEEAENNPVIPGQVQWMGDLGIWKRREHSNRSRYDLVQRVDNALRVYYGVTEDGLHGYWSALVGE
ncbi:MAG: transcriptional regulator, partial [Anaerolineae bacterium]|nr:transcriptional regulator [Anaerolineae bacterium]